MSQSLDMAAHKLSLPLNIWTSILQEYVIACGSIRDILPVREVSKWFDSEILWILFVMQSRDLYHELSDLRRVPEKFTTLYLQGFFAQRKLLTKAQKKMRRALIRTICLDSYSSNAAETSCLELKSMNQPCTAEIMGPSSGSSCKAHDMMKTLALALGTSVLSIGSTLKGFHAEAQCDERYWNLLISAFRVGRNPQDMAQLDRFSNNMQDLLADEKLDKCVLSDMICDCFALAVRQNKPELVEILYKESSSVEGISFDLGKRVQQQNALYECVKLGHLSILDKLLPKWNFDVGSRGYEHCLDLIFKPKSLPLSTQLSMLRTMLIRTNEWRNVGAMQHVLICVGNSHEIQFLELIISHLKLQYFHHAETGPVYHGIPSVPLSSLAHHENPPEMVKLFLEHRSLLFPHLAEAIEVEMRKSTLTYLFGAREKIDECPARIENLMVIVEHSQDLLDSKHDLQNIIIKNHSVALGKWSWLAKKLGLASLCDESHDGHTLGSAIMEKAVAKLNVDVVRFLVDNGVGLAKEATTPAVNEDDDAAMVKLETVKRLLTRGGQGLHTEKRTITTTFTASRVDVTSANHNDAVRKRLLGEPISRMRVNAPSTLKRGTPSSRARFLKRGQQGSWKKT